jgi:nucleotide-binding universal stress UspA family protein
MKCSCDPIAVMLGIDDSDGATERGGRQQQGWRYPMRNNVNPTAEQADANTPPDRVERILVAVDASDAAGWAVDAAVRLAAGLGAELALVHVSDQAPRWSAYAGERATVDDSVDDATALLYRAARRVPSSMACLKLLGEGDAGREIVRAAQQWEADLLFIGGHSQGHVSQLFVLGSVADYVVRHAPCPVTTVLHPQATHDVSLRRPMPRETSMASAAVA